MISIVRRKPRTLTLRIGQAVAWPSSPTGVAQVVELLRRKVRLYYPSKHGKPRHALVKVERIRDEIESGKVKLLLLPGPNPYTRSAFPAREKTFKITSVF